MIGGVMNSGILADPRPGGRFNYQAGPRDDRRSRPAARRGLRPARRPAQGGGRSSSRSPIRRSRRVVAGRPVGRRTSTSTRRSSRSRSRRSSGTTSAPRASSGRSADAGMTDEPARPAIPSGRRPPPPLADPAPADYPWMTDELAAIRRPFGPDDLAPLLAAAGVDAHGPRPDPLEPRRDRRPSSRPRRPTPFVARRRRLGRPDATRASPTRSPGSASLPGGDRLVGIRHQVHDEPDPDWLRRADVRRGHRRRRRRRPRLRPPRPDPGAAGRRRHGPRPAATSGSSSTTSPSRRSPRTATRLAAWAHAIRRSARCRTSPPSSPGLVTEADWSSWTVDDLAGRSASRSRPSARSGCCSARTGRSASSPRRYDRVLDAAIEALDRARARRGGTRPASSARTRSTPTASGVG